MHQRILVVDDAIAQHRLINAALSEESLELVSAYSGASGLTMAASLNPDLILLDVDMPEMNGFDFCRLLKVNRATTGIPVIFLTASASMDEKICGFSLDAVDYITKPFDQAELCARVRVALRHKRILEFLPQSAVGMVGSRNADDRGDNDPSLWFT